MPAHAYRDIIFHTCSTNVLERKAITVVISVLLMNSLVAENASAQVYPDTIQLSELDGTNGFKIDGEDILDFSGRSVSGAGDINNDGIDDLIIGSPRFNGTSFFSGRSYIIYGKPGNFNSNLQLSNLDESNGFSMDGGISEFAGNSVSSAGDINGDGIADLVIGAPGGDPGIGGAGISYVVFGKDFKTQGAFPANIKLFNLNGINGFKLAGEASSNSSGNVVSDVGDINGDGIDDLIIGTRYANPNGFFSGRCYIVFGRNVDVVGDFSSLVQLTDLDGDNGFAINGEFELDRACVSVSSAGDINNDGIDDAIIGATGSDFNGGYSGSSYVIYGSNESFSSPFELSSINGENGFRIDGEDSGDFFGKSVAGIGDFNGDGIDDILIGAYLADHNDIIPGAGYVIFGQSSNFKHPFRINDLNGSNGFSIFGELSQDIAGYSVSNAGDINSDGLNDIIISAPRADTNGSNSGRSYVIFGHDNMNTPIIELAELDNALGFKIDGEAESDQAGRAVSNAGDINGDGVDDILIGAEYASSNGFYSGRSYVVFGGIDIILISGFE